MALRIVIDVRRIGDFGVGTYIRNLLQGLAGLDRENRYVLVALRPDEPELSGLPPNFQTAVCGRSDTDWVNQFAFYFFLKRLAPDLVHLPLNVVPLLMPCPYVVTIHDMSSLLFSQRWQMRRNFRLFQFRRGLLRAERVIAVSLATRRDVESLLGIPAQRIRQIYDAPDPRFLRNGGPASLARLLPAANASSSATRSPTPSSCTPGGPPPEEHSAADRGIRGVARRLGEPPGVQGPPADHHRRRDLQVPFGPPGGHQDARRRGGPVSRLRAGRDPPCVLRGGFRVCLSFALRGLRPATLEAWHVELPWSPPASARCRKLWATPPCW